jgi:hypothetical protein
LGFFIFSICVLSFWGIQFANEPYAVVLKEYSYEMILSCLYFIVSGTFYFFWLRQRLQRSVQVFEDHILICHLKKTETLHYSEIENINIVCWSIFYVKMKSGIKHYFNSSLERVDYIWEGIRQARPDLMSEKEYEEFRVKLVQYDHHQKRKEWFFKHKLVDVFNWILLPMLFMSFAYLLQTKYVHVHQEGLYFFRLFMFSLLALLVTSFVFSMTLKKLVFDKKVAHQMHNDEVKLRDLEFEGVILQRSKMFQLITTCFILALVIKHDVNLFSISKVKEDVATFNLKKGHTIIVDNRYNCFSCRYSLKDGDMVVFGRGTIGQILAQEGDMVGEIAQDDKGRMIASENVQEVPRGHVAVKAANGKDISFVKIDELIGKIQN